MCDYKTKFIAENLNISEEKAADILNANGWDTAKILQERDILPTLDQTDIILIMDQAEVDYDTARNALISSGGDLINALMSVAP